MLAAPTGRYTCDPRPGARSSPDAYSRACPAAGPSHPQRRKHRPRRIHWTHAMQSCARVPGKAAPSAAHPPAGLSAQPGDGEPRKGITLAEHYPSPQPPEAWPRGRRSSASGRRACSRWRCHRQRCDVGPGHHAGRDGHSSPGYPPQHHSTPQFRAGRRLQGARAAAQGGRARFGGQARCGGPAS